MNQELNADDMDRFQQALNELFRSTRGMHDDVAPAVEKFKHEAFPYSENALNLMVSSGWVDEDFHRKTEGGGVLKDIYEALGGQESGKPGHMPEHAKTVWDELCGCYILTGKAGS